MVRGTVELGGRIVLDQGETCELGSMGCCSIS